MACDTNRTTILNGIKNRITEISGLQRQGNTLLNSTFEIREDINNLFQEEVLNEQGEFNISEELIDFYEQTLAAEEANNPNTPFLQQERNENLPETPTKILNSIKGFLERAGVKFQEVADITINGKRLSANGAALPLQSLILFTQGNEEITLSEEAYHIGVELLSQKRSDLFQEMMSQITNYPIYKQVLSEYKNEEAYQINGKPDINKIKKEAIGKLLVQETIDRKAQNWWIKVKNWLKQFFLGYQTELSVYAQAVDIILGEDLGTVRDTLLKSEIYLKEQGLSDEQAEDIVDLAYSNITDDELRVAIGNTIVESTFLQIAPNKISSQFQRLKADNSKVNISADGLEITVNNNLIKNTFIGAGEKAIKSKLGKVSTTAKKILADIQNNPQSMSHRQVKDVLSRFIDVDGTLLEEQKRKSPSILLNDANYNSVEDEVRLHLESFVVGTLFLNSTKVFSPKTNTAGEIDLIALTPDGVTHILQFQETNFKEDERMNAVERQALQAELDAARKVLRSDYGVYNFGLLRAIPLNRQENNGVITVEVGRRNYDNETQDYLYPVPSQLESTGSPKLDSTLKEIGQIYSKFHNTQDQSVEQGKLNTTLNGLMRAARTLQINKDTTVLKRQARIVGSKMEELIEEYKDKWAKMDVKSADTQQVRSYMTQLLIMSQISDTLSDINKNLAGFLEDELQVKAVSTSLNKINQNYESLRNTLWNFTNKFSAIPNGIQTLLAQETQKSWFTRQFRGISESNIGAVELLGKLTQSTESQVELERSAFIDKLLPIKKEFEAWVKSKGFTKKNQLNLLTKKDEKGRYIHQLIDKYAPEFYQEVTKARETNNVKWVNDNIDLPAYNKWFEQYKKVRREIIEDSVNTNYSYATTQEKEDEIEKRYQEQITIFDLTQGVNEQNNQLKNFPKDQYSQEYKTLLLKENGPALRLYNLFEEENSKALNSGVIDTYTARNFLPFLRKSIGDKIAFGGLSNLPNDIFNSFSITEDEAEFVSGEEKKVPFFMLYDISKKRIDPATGTEYRDYSDISTDIFTLLDLYHYQNIKYDLFKGIEPELLAASLITRTKTALETTRFGDASQSGAEVDNSVNANYFENLLDLTLYGKKNVGAASDVKLGTTNNKFAKFINKTLGREIIEETEKDRVISGANVLDGTKRYFILKTLGFKLPTAVASAIGTTLQGHIEAGNFFTKTEYIESWTSILGGKFGQVFGGQKDNVRVGLVDYLMPLSRGENNREKARQLTLAEIKKFSFPNFLMSLLNYSDRASVYANTDAYLRNTMVEDGKFVNIREFVKNQSQWASLPTKEERDAAKAQMEKDINTLKEKRGLDKTAAFNTEGVLEIPGIERTSEEVAKLRTRIMNIAANATGMSGEVSGGQGNALFRMFITFKSWIYPLYTRRVENLRKTPGTDTYDWGRYRVFGNFVSKALETKGAAILDIINNTDQGIQILKDEYEKQREKYRIRTGREMDDDFTESRFVELYNQQLKNAATEFTYILALLAALTALAAAAPDGDDEDKRKKNFYNYMLKSMDKGVDELLFFINPKEMYKLSQGGILPPAAVFKDVLQINKHMQKQVWGYIDDNNEEMDKAQPTKYILKALPLGSSVILPMTAMANAELAEELGYTEEGPNNQLR